MTDGPVIGVTATTELDARPYAEAVRRHGGDPLLFLPVHSTAELDTLGELNGLLVSGGEDIHPSRFGEEPATGEEAEYAPARDSLEIPLVEAALERDLPVLGICRGMQLLNVVLGGSLTSHLEGHDSYESNGEELASYHRIFITPGSKLAAIVGSGGFVRVNSLHHQGVREAQKSPRLLASAYSLDDGVIEALESPDHGWVIGVQFHPERRMEVPPHFDRLFGSLVERASIVRRPFGE